NLDQRVDHGDRLAVDVLDVELALLLLAGRVVVLAALRALRERRPGQKAKPEDQRQHGEDTHGFKHGIPRRHRPPYFDFFRRFSSRLIARETSFMRSSYSLMSTPGM